MLPKQISGSSVDLQLSKGMMQNMAAMVSTSKVGV